MALMETLVDNFDFGGVDTGKWTVTGGSQVVIGTGLDCQMTSSLGGSYISISSIATFNLTGSYAYCQITDAGNQSITSWEMYPVYLIADANNKLLVRLTGNTVQAIKVVAGVTSNVGASVSYNSATMKWFRILESAGTIFWDYAADPTGSWTNITSVATPITITALTGEILTGTWQAESSTTTGKYDNWNTYPTQNQFTWQGLQWNKRIHAGPAANNQTWSAANVGTPDANDYLTLNLSNAGSAPIGCEIFSVQRGFGYGTYTMITATRLDNIDAASCFGGMFTFDFTAPPDYREIDMDETRDYGQQVTKNILHSHVYNNGGSGTFITDSDVLTADVIQTHVCIWTPTKISFRTYIGSDTSGTLLFSHDHETNMVLSGLERVHFNIFVDVSITGFATVAALAVVIRKFTFDRFREPGNTGRHITVGAGMSRSEVSS